MMQMSLDNVLIREKSNVLKKWRKIVCIVTIEAEKERAGMEVLKPFLQTAFRMSKKSSIRKASASSHSSTREKNLVCVTSGNSYFGSHVIKQLLAHGYLVRVTIEAEVQSEEMKELMREEELNLLESVVVAKLQDLGSLCDAFRGCYAVFYTSSFIDPKGIVGYTEQRAFLETEGARKVMEACNRAASVKRCVFTSSLLACIWTGNNSDRFVDESCWSNLEFCRENKLWLALGKTMAEKTAWKMSSELKVKLVTLCPGLLMAPSFPNAHGETSRPYLKGGQIMLQQGVLATGDVKKVAEAHVHVYEAMEDGVAHGRYVCFDRVVRGVNEAMEIENWLKAEGSLTGGSPEASIETDEEIQSSLSNFKLSNLLSRSSRSLSCQ